MASPPPSLVGSSSSALSPPCRGRSGKGLYLTAKAKEFLRKKLDNNNHGNWYNLAAEMGIFDDSEIENIEFELQKSRSPTIELLRRYEKKNGGVDEERFMSLLKRIERFDIIEDFKDYVYMYHVDDESDPLPLVEKRNAGLSPTPSRPPSQPPSQNPQGVPTPSHNDETQLSNGQTITVEGNMKLSIQVMEGSTFTNVGGASSSVGGVSPLAVAAACAGGATSPHTKECSCLQTGSALATSDSRSGRSGTLKEPSETMRQPSPQPKQADRPKSDPVSRKVPNLKYDGEGPRNLRESNSSPSVGERHEGCNAPIRVRERAPMDAWQPPCEAEHMQGRDYSSLVSHPNPQAAHGGARPSPVQQERCFIISTIAIDDMAMLNKVSRSLRMKNRDVHTIHDNVPQDDKLHFFSSAKFVVVIYTRTYEAEIKSIHSLNWEFYQKIKEEYRRMGNRNMRFVPVFEPREVSMMPNAFLGCDRQVKERVVGLLSQGTPQDRPQTRPPLSPNIGPPHANGCAMGCATPPGNWSPNNLSPSSEGSSRNDRSLGSRPSPRTPHIVCESHARPTDEQPKMKEKIKGLFKSKKGK